MSTPYGPSDDKLTKYEGRWSCGRILYGEMSYCWDYENSTYERRYAHLGDAWSWMTINLLPIAIYTKLCGIQPYLISLLSMTIYETSNWTPRCRYTYRQPCCTEYYPDYHSREQITCRMAAIEMSIKMPIIIPNTMPNLLRSYITKNTLWNEIPTQTRRSQAIQLGWQLTTTNRLRNELRIKSFQSIFPIMLYEISRQRSNDFQKRWMSIPELQPLPYRKYKNKAPWDTFTNGEGYQWQVHLETNWLVDSENDDKCTESSDGKHTYRSINTHTWWKARERIPRSETISSPSIRQTSSIPANAPQRDDKSNEPDPCRTSAI